ncbi:hypothetical protein ACQKPX_07235 [Photobacterium sp. DNB23_23_1]
MKAAYKYTITLLLMLVSVVSYSATKDEVMRLGFREQTKPMILSNSEVVQIEGLAKVWATETKAWILIINYRTDTLELAELKRKADLIWEKFKPIVEKEGMKYAGIHAKKYLIPNPTHDTNFVGHNFILMQGMDDEWMFLEH